MGGSLTELLEAAREQAAARDAGAGAEGELADALCAALQPRIRSAAKRFARMAGRSPYAQTEAFVTEGCLKALDQLGARAKNGRHLVGVATLAMRRMAMDLARAELREKRGAGRTLDLAVALDCESASFPTAEELLDLDAALTALEAGKPVHAAIVCQRYFLGLDYREIAAVLGLSDQTVRRRWEEARQWLFARLRG